MDRNHRPHRSRGKTRRRRARRPRFGFRRRRHALRHGGRDAPAADYQRAAGQRLLTSGHPENSGWQHPALDAGCRSGSTQNGRKIVKRISTCLTFCFLAVLLPAGVRAKVSAQAGGTAAAPKQSSATQHTASTRLDPALLHPSTLKATAPDEYEVTFKTTAGDFVVKVTRAWAPLGADRFYNLVRHGFFSNAAFFRVVPGFVVQFGLNANPAVNAAWEKG